MHNFLDVNKYDLQIERVTKQGKIKSGQNYLKQFYDGALSTFVRVEHSITNVIVDFYLDRISNISEIQLQYLYWEDYSEKHV